VCEPSHAVLDPTVTVLGPSAWRSMPSTGCQVLKGALRRSEFRRGGVTCEDWGRGALAAMASPNLYIWV
jgi:hypothetical protein